MRGEKSGNAVLVKLREDTPAAMQIADHLYKQGIQSLLIEGGARVLEHFISSGIWDEARIFTGKADFKNGIKAPAVTGNFYAGSDFESTRLEAFMNDQC